MSLPVSNLLEIDSSSITFALVGSGNEDAKKKTKNGKKAIRKKPIISSDDSNDKVITEN